MLRPALLSLPLFLTALTAQRTVVVDTNNGPGTNHLTLTAALADLQAQDLIVVRAGTYEGSTKSTQHSFSLHGEGNPVVIPPIGSPAQTMQFTMWGGQAQRVNIRGVRFESTATSQWALVVGTFQNFWPAPTVHIEDCEVVSLSPLADRVGLLAQAIGLTVRGCYLNTTQVVDSVASFDDTTIVGRDATTYLGVTQRAQTALDVLRSEVWLIDCSLTAGSSFGVYAEPATCLGFSDNTFTRPSRVHACGQTTLAADPAPHPQWPSPWVFQDYAPWYPVDPTVEYEASVVLSPTPGGGLFSAGVTAVQGVIPHQTTTAAPLGGTFTTTVRSSLGDIVLAYASMSSFAMQLGTWELFMDLPSAAPLGFAVLTAGTSAQFQIAIPNDPTLRGTAVEVTGAALTVNGLAVTNPAAGLLR